MGKVMLQVRNGKGGKDRIVFLGVPASAGLGDYLQCLGDQPPDSPVWVTTKGTRLTYAGLRQVVRRRAQKAGVPAPSLHSFRRAFARACHRNGMNLEDLKLLMGHADLTTLLGYLDPALEDLRESHEQASPVDRLFMAAALGEQREP